MIGEQYWATGISLRPSIRLDGSLQWSARLNFYDSGFCQDASTEGTLHTRYFVNDIANAIDTLLKDAQHLGIGLGRGDAPFLYIEGDGEDKDWPSPANWREILTEQAARIGWQTYRVEAPHD